MHVKSPKRGILLGIGAVVLSLLLIMGYTAPVLADVPPVLDVGESGEWDDTHVSEPFVIKDGGTYKMWYSGVTLFAIRIGYATSPDGINWNKYEGNPVLDLGAGGQWDQDNVSTQCVIKDGATYKMWYSGKSGGYWKIGYATSSDGISWTKSGANPVLDVSAGGNWDDVHVYQPCVIKDDTEPTYKYKMWYSGSDGTTIKIGYANSTDGINWNKYEGNPVLDLGAGGQWDDYHAYAPNVIKEDGTYKMWYTGYDGTTSRIGYATSSEGTNWNKHTGNPVFSESSAGNFDESEVQRPCVIFDLSYMMWYRGQDSSDKRRIGYAISDDGIDWTRVGVSEFQIGSLGFLAILMLTMGVAVPVTTMLAKRRKRK